MAKVPEVILALPGRRENVADATHVRGTVLVASQRSLKARNVWSSYQSLIEPEFRDTLSLVLASSWVPIDAAVAHYRACDRLQLDPEDIRAIGRETGRIIYSATVAVVMKLSSQFGTSPLAILRNLDRFSERTWQGGGGFEVELLGPKEAEVLWFGQPCGVVPYFRDGFGAFLCGTFEPLCRMSYYRVVRPPEGTRAIAYRFSWV
jgi:hypothetical protein